ncbi:hypothetical protein [Streptomyces spinoverrucosus]|nr:hypothetical protein [Streptomyces spinoverrucosus]
MKFIHLALRQAGRSACRFRVGAALAAGNRVLAAQPNKYRNPGRIDFRHSTFHAEEAVLRRVTAAGGTDIYVARLDAAGRPALARPCERCMHTLADAGVLRAHYTTAHGDVHTIDVRRAARGTA